MLSSSSSQKGSPAIKDANSESQLPGMLQVKDIVWARPDRSFPYWPACVLSLDLLPASVLAGLNANVHPDTDEDQPKLVREITPKTLFAKRKVVLFFFGRSDYDFVSVDDVQTFNEDDEYVSQDIKPSLRVSFDRGVELARVESYKRSEDRLSWLVGTFEEHIPTITEGDFTPFSPTEDNYINLQMFVSEDLVESSTNNISYAAVEIAEIKLPVPTMETINATTEVIKSVTEEVDFITAEHVAEVSQDMKVDKSMPMVTTAIFEAQPPPDCEAENPRQIAVESVVEFSAASLPTEIITAITPVEAVEAHIQKPSPSLSSQEEAVPAATSSTATNSGGTAGDRTSKVFKGRAIRQNSGLTLFDGDSAKNNGPSLFGSPAIPSSSVKKVVKSDPFGAAAPLSAVGASPFDQRPKPSIMATNIQSTTTAVTMDKPALPAAIVPSSVTSVGQSPLSTRSNSSASSVFGGSESVSTGAKKVVAGFSGFDRQASNSNSAFAAQELFMSSPGPAAASVPVGRRTSAADVFSSQPPPTAIIPPPVANGSGIMAPPSAPGVKPQVIAPAAVLAVPPAPGSGDGSTSGPKSNSANNPSTKKAASMMAPPPNAIVTPHGYVLAAAPQAASPPSMSNNITAPAAYSQGGPSIFTPSANTAATTSAAWPSAPSTLDSSASVSYPSGPIGRYQRPISAVSSLGFGGKLVVWLPDRQLFPPVYRSSTGGGDRMRAPQQLPLLGARPASFKVYSIDKLSPPENQQNLINIEELKRFQELLRQPFVSLVDLTTKMIAKPTRSLLSQAYQQQQAGLLSSTMWTMHESLLWEVLSLLLAPGSNTNKADSDSLSTEQRIVQLLVARSQDMQSLLPVSSPALRTTSNLTWQHHPNHAEELEELLIAGRRDDALELSITRQDWATAMLLSSIASLDKYQEVVRLYSASRFVAQSPSSLLMMAFSNQGMTALQSPVAKPTAFISTSEPQSNDEMVLLRYWMKDTAALLANQVTGWQELITTLSTRLLEKTGDIVIAQIILLCAGLLPPTMPEAGAINKASAPPTSSKREESSSNKPTVNKDLWLLGCNRRIVVHDVESLTAFRMSEVLETILAQAAGLQTAQPASGSSNNKNAQSASSGSSSSMFGWLVGGSNAANTSSRNDSSGSEVSSGAITNKQHFERWTSYRLFLLPLKLRLAMILADHGIIDQAVGYVTQVSQLVRAMSDERSPERQALGTNYSKLSKKMLQALEEMEDRLNTHQRGLHVIRADGTKETVKSSNTAVNKPSSWGGLGTWSISAASLRSFVDGPAQQQPDNAAGAPTSAAATTIGTMPQAVDAPQSHQAYQYPLSNISQGTPSGMIEVDLSDNGSHHHQQQYQQQYQQQQAPFSGGTPPHPMPNYSQQYPPGRAPSYSTASAANLTSPSVASGSTGWFVGNTPPTASPPSSTAGTSNGSSAPPSNSYGSNQNFTAGPGSGGYNNSGGYGQPGIASGGYSQPQAIETTSRPRSGNELSSSNTNSQQLTPTAAAAAKDNAKEVKKGGSATDITAPSGGLFGMMRKNIIKFISPNAHDATENIGGALEAYFDKDKNCWVFPGEEAQAPSALPPPPTGMMGGTNNGSGQAQSQQQQNNGMPTSMSYSAFGASSSAPLTNNGGAVSGVVDPLAALMAPPPLRNMSSASSNANSSVGGLDQLMAPPSFRRSATGSGTGSSASLSNMAGGPPPSVNIWKPPAATLGPAPVPLSGSEWQAPVADNGFAAAPPLVAEVGYGDNYNGNGHYPPTSDGMMLPPPPSSQFSAPPPPSTMSAGTSDFFGDYANYQGGGGNEQNQQQQILLPPPPPSMMFMAPPPTSL